VSSQAGKELREARRQAELWIDLEELVRFADPNMTRSGVPHLTSGKWAELIYKGKGTRDTALRAFERWKRKVRPLGVLLPADEELAFHLERRPGDLYGLDKKAVAAGAEKARAKLRDLTQRYQELTGRIPRKGLRNLTAQQAARALGLHLNTIRRWAKKEGLKSDKDPKHKQRRLYSLEEVEAVRDRLIREGKTMGRLRERMPLEEAAPRLRAVASKLNVSLEKLAELLGLGRSALWGYVGLSKRIKTAPVEIVERAEQLARELPPQISKRGFAVEPELVRAAVKRHGGNASAAARELGVDSSTIRNIAIRLGFESLLKTGFDPLVIQFSRREIIDAMRASNMNVKEAARKLGLHSQSMYDVIHQYGLVESGDVTLRKHGVVPPPSVIEETLRSRHMTRQEAARELGISPFTLDDVLGRLKLKHLLRHKGYAYITDEPQFWKLVERAERERWGIKGLANELGMTHRGLVNAAKRLSPEAHQRVLALKGGKRTHGRISKQELLAALESSPGVTAAARALKTGPKTLRVLARKYGVDLTSFKAEPKRGAAFSKEDVERALLTAADKPGGSLGTAASILGVARSSLERYVKRYGLEDLRDRLRVRPRRRKRKKENPPGDDYVLQPPGSTRQIGPETGRPVRDGIARFVSPHGSYRYVFYSRGVALAGMQIASRDGKHGTIAFVYTDPGSRRKGLARRLLQRARKDFGKVEHSEHLTDTGQAWKKGLGENPPSHRALQKKAASLRRLAEHSATPPAEAAAARERLAAVEERLKTVRSEPGIAGSETKSGSKPKWRERGEHFPQAWDYTDPEQWVRLVQRARGKVVFRLHQVVAGREISVSHWKHVLASSPTRRGVKLWVADDRSGLNEGPLYLQRDMLRSWWVELRDPQLLRPEEIL
jgi:transposase